MDDKKAKARLGLHVSTKMEQAWYVDPDLLAGEEGAEAERSEADGAEADATLKLDEVDLEAAEGELDEGAEDARHYRDVSLRGAVLAGDDLAPAHAEEARPRVRRAGPAALGRLSAAIAGLLQPGRVPPFWVAVISFLLGVVFTLVGVVIAL